MCTRLFSSHIQNSRMPSSACDWRSEEHTSELQSHSEISYAVFCLKKKKNTINKSIIHVPKNSIIELLLRMFDDYALYSVLVFFFFFFFNDTATTEIYTNLNTLSLHDALPISPVTFRNLVCRLLLVTG